MAVEYGGFFSRTSSNVELKDDGKLQASCRRSDGESVTSMLDLNFYLENSDGRVQFASQRPGNFLATSTNVTLVGTTLSGTAKQISTREVKFELDLDHNVANIEGRLVWLVNPREPHDSPDNDEGGMGSYDVSTDPEMAAYAKSLKPDRSKREVNITPASGNDKKDIQNLVRLWDLDLMDSGQRQATLVEFPRRPRPNEYRPHRQGWRIDNQENGSFPVNGTQYYNLAVQNGSAVYASVLVPVRYRVGRTRIRNAFLRSMDEGRVVTIALPPPQQRQPPPQDNPLAEASFVQSLAWAVLIGMVCFI